MLEWIVIGAIIGCAALAYFWDDIRRWLNSTAADFVERHLGYSARKRMQKAVAIVNRVFEKIRNKAIVYTKSSGSALYYDKTTIISETSVSSIDEDVIKELENNRNELVQEFAYK